MPAVPLTLERQGGAHLGEVTLWMPGTYRLELKTGGAVAWETFDVR